MAAKLCRPFDLGLAPRHVGSHRSTWEHFGVLPGELRCPRAACRVASCNLNHGFRWSDALKLCPCASLRLPDTRRVLPHDTECLATQGDTWVGSQEPATHIRQHSIQQNIGHGGPVAKPHAVPTGTGDCLQSGASAPGLGLQSPAEGRDWPGLGTAVPSQKLGLGLQ